jgi:uncharacterized protein YndB with AHSA1/START domain
MESSSAIRLNVHQDFNVSVDRLYDAWTKEDELKQWWHPLGNSLAKVTNDLREGGTVRYEFGNQGEGRPLIIEGVYKELKDKEKLVYTWNWKVAEDSVGNAEYLLGVRFQAQGNGSRLEVMQENFLDEEAVQPHKEGWEKGLLDLKSYLEKKH